MRFWFGSDPMSGTQYYVDYNESDDSITFIEEVDVTRLLEWNQQQYNNAPSRFNGGDSVAGLPTMLQVKLMREGIWDDPKARARWLNDIDHRKFRTRPGRV